MTEESTRVRTEDQATESMLCEAGCNPASMSIDEALTAALLQKKLQKEIPPTNNDAELQQKVDVSKSLEWETLLGKNAVKILDWGDKAKLSKESIAIVSSAVGFVIVKKGGRGRGAREESMVSAASLRPGFS